MKEIVDSYKNGIYKPPQYYGRGYPSLRMFNIRDGKINLDGAPLLDVTQQELSDYSLGIGDILINRVNSEELVGKAGIVMNDYGQVTFESKNIRVRVNREKCDPYFFNYFLNSNLYYKQIRSSVKAAIGQSTINQEDLNNVKIYLPNIQQQQIIALILSKVDELLQKTKQIIDHTRRLKNGLIQTLMVKGIGHSKFKTVSMGIGYLGKISC